MTQEPPDEQETDPAATMPDPPGAGAATGSGTPLRRQPRGSDADVARPFVAAVSTQLARAADPATGSTPASAFADDVLAILHAAADPSPGDSAATVERLSRDAPLLAAFFQNIDLLYQHGYAHADGVAALIMNALARLDESAGARLEEEFPARREPRAPTRDAPPPERPGAAE